MRVPGQTHLSPPTPRPWRTRSSRPPQGAPPGFTLIELLIVVLIMGLIMGIGIPNFVRKVRKDPLNQAMADLVDAFRDARGRAVLGGSPMQVVIEAGAGTIRVEPLRVPQAAAGGDGDNTPDGEETAGAATLTARIDERVAFKSLVVNNRDRMAEDLTAIRFYPNGTCDQFDSVLTWPRRGSRRISLEITTGLPEVGPTL